MKRIIFAFYNENDDLTDVYHRLTTPHVKALSDEILKLWTKHKGIRIYADGCLFYSNTSKSSYRRHFVKTVISLIKKRGT